MLSIKIRHVGNSYGAVFPQEVLKALGVREGDELFLVRTPNGYELTPYNTEFAQQMEIAEKGLRLYKNALRELAK